VTAKTNAIIVREAQEADVPAAADVFLIACADMLRRNNQSISLLPARESVMLGYEHVQKTGIFYVAQDSEEKITGVACGIIRDGVWFLSGFWMLPELQNQGIGKQMLSRVFQRGQEEKARKYFVWSSIDMTAMASYMRFGMLPGYQNFTFSGQFAGAVPSGYSLQPLNVDEASRIDSVVRETERRQDHAYWLERSGHQGLQVRKDGSVIGYFYELKGTIGPAGWLSDEHAQPLLMVACHYAAQRNQDVRLHIPGINKAAVNFSLANKFKLISYSHIFLSDAVGDFRRYIPSGALLY
jgi:GNAT superfamily N-acetyltransferase